MAAMASQLYYTSPAKFPLPKGPSTQRAPFLRQSQRIRRNSSPSTTKIVASGGKGIDLLGDFGARDPFPAEIESNFGEKVIGNFGTEHKILIPNATALSLSQQSCTPISPQQQPMSEEDAKQLLFKVVGWRLINEEGGLKLQCLWKLRDFHSGIELINRIHKAVEDTGHFPNLHLEQPNQLRAELWTSSIGGLSLNDFIVAAKIDEVKSSDLIPRKRVWA
ncbi:OLC1v1025070C1 [Oldenlandia corymbosa var. corymbosa]|uniref:4a-hydroxytetrahydrobiopterin dehydratase n=1 Tax=Oldenlandia corymbosa var. corymbosa TaxID=529605 RepID=A0AAV1C4C9_OLDCO|nr:OLC1v1025070C1 [Oldenlandia corymbosa var. corymbosa]